MKTAPKLLLTLLAAFSAGTAAAFAAAENGQIYVTKVTPPLEVVKPDGETDELEAKAVLGEDTVITTGGQGKASMWFANGAHLVVQRQTEVAITKFRVSVDKTKPPFAPVAFSSLSAEPTNSVTQLRLTQGKIVIEARKLSLPVTDFRVSAPFLVLNVRESDKGAAFLVEQTDEYAKVAVAKGTVFVKPLLNLGSETFVKEKQMVIYYLRKKPYVDNNWDYRKDPDFADDVDKPDPPEYPDSPRPPGTADPDQRVDPPVVTPVPVDPKSKVNGGL